MKCCASGVSVRSLTVLSTTKSGSVVRPSSTFRSQVVILLDGDILEPHMHHRTRELLREALQDHRKQAGIRDDRPGDSHFAPIWLLDGFDLLQVFAHLVEHGDTRLLPSLKAHTGLLHAVFPSRRGMVPAVRSLLDSLSE